MDWIEQGLTSPPTQYRLTKVTMPVTQGVMQVNQLQRFYWV